MNNTKMIKVVIADDSPLIRKVLGDLLKESGKIDLLGAAKDGKEAIDFVKKFKPDILILDCEMPVMNGLEALRKIMAECPLPVFMFSSLTAEGAAVTIKALEYGAVDYLLKPVGSPEVLKGAVVELINKLRFIHLRSIFSKMKIKTPTDVSKPVADRKGLLENIKARKIDLIAMGSSTGGVQAAMKVIPNLLKNSPPIVWVQHMPPNFTKSFAERLDGMSAIGVKEAVDGDIITAGNCYLAPGGYQMRIIKHGAGFKIKIGEQEKHSGHCPSCDVLFDSVSEYFSNNVLGIILTGMGEDGTKGLVKMHQKGAYVIGQDEESCVVYGMPKAANQAGAVDLELGIDDIAMGMIRACGLK